MISLALSRSWMLVKCLFVRHSPTSVTYYLSLCDHPFIVILLHSETDITSSLSGISPVLAGQIEELTLLWCLHQQWVCCGTNTLIDITSLPSTQAVTCHSAPYPAVTTVISPQPYPPVTWHTLLPAELDTDVSSAKGLARALTQSKTLEEVHSTVWASMMTNEVAQILLEAMNHSSVKKLDDRRC